MRLELTRVGLLVELANHYTTRGALDKYVDLTMKLKKLWRIKITMIPILINALATFTKKIGIATGGLGIKKTDGYITKNRIKIDWNAEICPRVLRKLAVTQTLVRNHQLRLV